MDRTQIFRFELDGSGFTKVIGAGVSNALGEDRLYTMQRVDGDSQGILRAYGLRGEAPRDLGAWGGFPTSMTVDGNKVAWWGGEFFDTGDDTLRMLVDDGVSSMPPASTLCTTGQAAEGQFRSDSVLITSGGSAAIRACALSGGEPRNVWGDAEYVRSAFVRGDSTLLGATDSTNAVTVLRFAWPTG